MVKVEGTLDFFYILISLSKIDFIIAEPSLQSHHVVNCFNKMMYICLFVLGCYMIYQGEVVQPYKLGRTNFAVYEESVVELPNSIMHIYPFTDVLEYGEDYRILVGPRSSTYQPTWTSAIMII